MSDAIVELRAALYACLDVEDAAAWTAWTPVVDRIAAACRAVQELEAAPAPADIEAMVAEFRAEASRQGRRKLALKGNALYPWGAVGYVDELAAALRYREVARGHEGPCNCALVREHGFYDQLQSHDFVKTGQFEDAYERYEDFRCPHCGAAWRHSDCSTEQVSDWSWGPL